jgi:imidazolonepropionase-like amidohydrolase
MRFILKITACFLSILVVFPPLISFAAEHPVLLKNAKIYTMGMEGVLEQGMILVKEGKIEKIGQDIAVPDEARVIDLKGKTIIPGMVCASASLFLLKRDLSFSGEESPDTDIVEGLEYFDPNILDLLKQGVTTVYIAPMSYRSIGGLGAVVKLKPGERRGMSILAEKAALNFRLETLQEKKTSNLLRLTQYHRIRDLFVQAQEYRKEWEDYRKKLEEYEGEKKKQDEQKKESTEERKKKGENAAQEPPIKKIPVSKALEEPKKPKKDEAKEVLVMAMEEKMPVRFLVHRPDAILHALRLADEFGLKVILEQSEEWPQVLPEIEKASVSLLCSPLLDYRKYLVPGAGKGYAARILDIQENDLLYSDEESVPDRENEPDMWNKLVQSKVPFALIPPDRFPLSARFMRDYASFLGSFGVSQEEVLRAVTSEAAAILGVLDRVGSLEEGKDADLVVLDGEPDNSLSRVDMVCVDGTIIWEKK